MTCRIDKLPKWAQREFEALQEQVELRDRRISALEEMLPWTEPGMDWFVLKTKEPCFNLFSCDTDGTHAVCSLGPKSKLFVGRSKG